MTAILESPSTDSDSSLETSFLVVHINKDPYDVRVDRQTRWGNPFRIGPDGTRQDVVLRFYHDLFSTSWGGNLLDTLEELRGLVLGCWCAPKGGLPPAVPPEAQCHAQILAYHALYDRGEDYD